MSVAALCAKAFALFDYLVMLAPDIVACVLWAGGEVFRQSGMFAQSDKWLKKAIKLSPEFWPACVSAELCLRASGHKGAALRFFNSAAELYEKGAVK